MIKKLKSLTSTEEKKRLVGNFFSLVILQGANYILPFLMFLYLVKIIGVEYFGLLSLASSIIAYLNIIVEYGFNLTATKEVSIYRDYKNKLDEIFSSVMLIKIFLMILTFFLLIVIVCYFDKFYKHRDIFYYTFGIIIGNLLFPTWFFQGLEKMKYITNINIIIKICSIILIFVIVTSKEDYYIVPIIISISYIISGSIALYIAFIKFKITFKFVNLNILKKYIQDGWSVFFSSFLTMPYTVGLPFILGIFTNNVVVGEFSIAQKIVNAINSLYQPFIQTIYPYIAKSSLNSINDTKKILRKILKISLIIMFIISIIICVFAKYIIYIFINKNIENAIIILQIMSFLPVLITVGKIMSFNYIITFNWHKKLIDIYLKGSIISIILILIFVPLYQGIGAAISILITEMYITYLMYKFIKRYIGF